MTHRSRAVNSPRGFSAVAIACGVLIALPLVALVIRVPWSQFWLSLSSDAATTALSLSIRTSLISTSLAVVTGLPLAWLLAHRNFRGIAIVRALCVLPMVLPPVVGGVALLYAFGTKGVVGSALNDWWGVRLAFTQTAAVLAQYFVAVPFFIVVMESAFQQFDQRLAHAARTLGAGAWRTLVTITLPVVRPALIAGIVLTWARALGEFGATITFAGNTPGRTQTLPLAIYMAFENGDDQALVLSFVMMTVSFVALVLLRQHWISALKRGGQ
ncbi:MAG: molybdate ABC transporter permease subunit [Ilumatobacteraceae bacterium]|nr:molybdate ABC transporter permease subunit [Ilumatobacteraceae bacterium]